MLKITLDNHEGYYKLYKLRTFSLDENDIKNNCKKIIFIGGIEVLNLISVIVFGILNMPFLTTTMSLGFFISPFIYAYELYKEKRNKIEKEYPNIDINVETEELIEALKNAEILKYEKKNDITYRELDKDGYLKFLEKEKRKKEYISKCENIKNEVVRDYKIVQNDFSIDEEQLEKVKVKVKTLVRNRD